MPDQESGYDPNHAAARASSTVDELVAAYLDRLNSGETIDPFVIISDHPDIADEILEKLETFVELTRERTNGTPLGTLGDYTLRRQIGRGGMGVVYDAWQNSMDRRVALKVLPKAIAVDTKSVTRFVREAQLAGKLDHPNVVHVHGMGLEEQVPYYAMEFVEGETLAQLSAKIKDVEPEADTVFGKKDRPGYFEKIAEAFADVADGLQHAHSKGVIHRDIKPSNLIHDEEGRLRILDFGLARLEGQETITISGDVVGTPLYMSPEQACQKKIQVDHRTDIYSLGATMYQVLCGRPPFKGRNHQDTLSQIIERDPIQPRKINPRVPRDLETIVLKCLRKDSGDRFGTAEALAQDLRRVVRGDPVEARPEGRWDRVRRRIVRNRRRIITGTLILISLLACGGLAYMLALEEKEKGRFQDVEAVKEVNSTFMESSPTYSANGLELYFGSTRQEGLGSWDIWVVRRSHPRGAWSEPCNVAELNSSDHEEPAWLSPDGLRLYYKARVAMIETEQSYGSDGCIRLATRTEATPGAKWKPAPDEDLVEVNAHFSDGQPSLTSDELELYFSSRRAGGAGETDLWVAKRPNRDSPWGQIRNLQEINGPYKETSPCISADGLHLWWTLRSAGEIYYACRDSRKSRFGDPVLLELSRNSAALEFQLEVSHDWPTTGTVAYFVSLLAKDNSDIYQAVWRPGTAPAHGGDGGSRKNGQKVNSVPQEKEP